MVSAAAKRDQFRPIATRIAIRRGQRIACIPVEGSDELRTLTTQEAADLKAMMRDDHYADLAMCEIEHRVKAMSPGINWGGILQWIRDHWQEALVWLLKILPIFLAFI